MTTSSNRFIVNARRQMDITTTSVNHVGRREIIASVCVHEHQVEHALNLRYACFIAGSDNRRQVLVHDEPCPRRAPVASYTHNPSTGHTRDWRHEHRRDCLGLSRVQIAVRHLERIATARIRYDVTLTPETVREDMVHDAQAAANAYGANWYDVFKALPTTREIGHRLDEARRRWHGQQWDITNVPADRHRLNDVPDRNNEHALYYRGAKRGSRETGDEGTTIVVFATDDSLHALFASQHIQMDATFDTV